MAIHCTVAQCGIRITWPPTGIGAEKPHRVSCAAWWAGLSVYSHTTVKRAPMPHQCGRPVPLDLVISTCPLIRAVPILPARRAPSCLSLPQCSLHPVCDSDGSGFAHASFLYPGSSSYPRLLLSWAAHHVLPYAVTISSIPPLPSHLFLLFLRFNHAVSRFNWRLSSGTPPPCNLRARAA